MYSRTYSVGDSFSPPPSIQFQDVPVTDVTLLSPNVSSPSNPSPYVWDKKNRPNVNDYIAPWIDKASETMYKYTGTKKKKLHNAAVTYAKNQLEAALSQYDNDLSFWNERDERHYTSQASQAQRFEDAGFNMGYMYSQVDNGNSAVGYDQESADFSPNENIGDNLGGAKMVADISLKALSLVVPFMNAGISLAKLPAELALLASQKALNVSAKNLNISAESLNYSRDYYQSLQSSFLNYIQGVSPDGKQNVGLGDSLAFASEVISYKLKDAEFTDLNKWNQVADQIYNLQATPSADKAFNDWVMSQNMPDWCKVLCIVLGSFVSNASPTFGVRKTIK